MFRRAHATAVVLVSAALWACGGDDPAQSVAPSASASTARPIVVTAQRTNVVNQEIVGAAVTSKPDLFVCHGTNATHRGSATIGRLGGVVHIGPHTLTVPPMALLETVTITGTATAGDTIAVAFAPQGLKFLVPATLALDYSHCSNKPAEPLTVDLLDNAFGAVLDLLPSTDKRNGRVTAPIWHFSVYAAAETRR